MKVVLDPHGDRLVSDLVAKGRFGTADDAVREALRLLEEREEARKDKAAEIDRAIRAGLDSGPPEDHDMEDVIRGLERRSVSGTV